MFNFTVAPPLSLYIHIPWCEKKCPYCDFNSHVEINGLPEIQYIDALLADLDFELQDLAAHPAFSQRPLISIFIGGGTPSLFSAAAIARLLDGVKKRMIWADDIEITLEANPNSSEAIKFSEFRAAGVNRLSIGVQSFQEDLLPRIGRLHDKQQAVRAAEAAHHVGFANFNLDLMFGLPQQTLAQALNDIDTAVALSPTHISHYQLTLEANTAFAARPPRLPHDDLIWEMQHACQQQLAQADYQHYEVSAYARTHKQSRHNLNYWLFGDYLGIGAGAHQKLTNLGTHSITRRWKQRLPQQYLSGINTQQHVEGTQIISEKAVGFEFMLNALRLIDGFPTRLFDERCGLPLSTVNHVIETAIHDGLLQQHSSHLRTTPHGMNYLNDLLERFL
ncbi:MAG: radical SAM family heme chaperone HemW [Gammaproteobacteria bacterium]|nr:radical SAM family heme chaperone HemW [Gammaproteobacteria bacterium]